MGEIRLPESELKVMDIVWERGAVSAKEAAEHMSRRYGWKKNTTYTVLKNLQDKGAVQRQEPGFICVPLVRREQIGRSAAKSLLNSFYKGSAAALFSSFLEEKAISAEELEQIKAMIDSSE
ncbi:MAG: BlaI/MecI/CopY family transcriptional regulator [Syntrophomonadaceae bacterium]|nr:BlaI/MecI/CopY family transcriptional regulator [Syntrophomonadaceae bacterium]